MGKYLSEKHRKEYLEYFGIDAKKFLLQRILLAIGVGLFVGVMGVVLRMPVILLLAPVGAVVGYKVQYVRLLNDKAHDSMLKSFIFPQFLRYFIALIGTQGNVYQTLKAVVPYLGGQMGDKLEEFIAKIEIDNSHDYYTEFAEYVGTNEAHMVMGMIYDFSEKGIVREEIEELERMIDKLNENKTNQMVKYKTDEQEKYMNMPIIASIFFVMSFAVVIIVKNFMEISVYLGG